MTDNFKEILHQIYKLSIHIQEIEGNEYLKSLLLQQIKHLQKYVDNILNSQKDRFPITYVCRDDLMLEGFDTTNISDSTIKELAKRMADAYCNYNYWIHLRDIATFLNIPRKDEIS